MGAMDQESNGASCGVVCNAQAPGQDTHVRARPSAAQGPHQTQRLHPAQPPRHHRTIHDLPMHVGARCVVMTDGITGAHARWMRAWRLLLSWLHASQGHGRPTCILAEAGTRTAAEAGSPYAVCGCRGLYRTARGGAGSPCHAAMLRLFHLHNSRQRPTKAACHASVSRVEAKPPPQREAQQHWPWPQHLRPRRPHAAAAATPQLPLLLPPLPLLRCIRAPRHQPSSTSTAAAATAAAHAPLPAASTHSSCYAAYTRKPRLFRRPRARSNLRPLWRT